MLTAALKHAAQALSGEVVGGEILCPGPRHSAADRSLSVKLDPQAPDGFVVHSFSGDDPKECRDYVRRRLGMPPFEPREKGKANSDGDAGERWQVQREHIYRTETGEPHTRVRKLRKPDGKPTFAQAHWDKATERWIKGKPSGPKLPYLLPQLLAAPLSAVIYFCEGEKDADSLAKISLTATTTSEGAAAPWDPALTPYFKDRHVVILPDADRPGRRRGQTVARALVGVAASVRVVDLFPDRNDGSDVTDWLENDIAGVRLAKLAKDASLWEPSGEGGKDEAGTSGDDADDELIAELASLTRLAYAKRRKEAAEKLGIGVSELDKIVAEVRGGRDKDADSDALLYAHWHVELWEEPVDGAILLRALTEAVRRYVVIDKS